MYKNRAAVRISSLEHPKTKAHRTNAPRAEATEIRIIAEPADRGSNDNNDPTMVSPNNPPIPKLCVHNASGTSDAAYTETNATNIGAKTKRDVARSAPACKNSRAPQTISRAEMLQLPRPRINIKGDAIVAPVNPNQFWLGTSVAAAKPGSKGE